MIRINKGPAPEILSRVEAESKKWLAQEKKLGSQRRKVPVTGVMARDELIRLYDAGKAVHETGRGEEKKTVDGFASEVFDSKLYGHNQVKSRLREVQYGKCVFCESKILDLSHGDVEHFRPKAGFTQYEFGSNSGQSALVVNTYFWFAYDWDNLYLSCQICNQVYKKNRFELIPKELGGGDRASAVNKAVIENQLLVDPGKEDPREYIRFNVYTGAAENWVLDSSNQVNQQKLQESRGGHTIVLAGLNRRALVAQRLAHLVKLRALYLLARGNGAEKADAYAALQRAVQPFAEFSSLAIDAIWTWQQEDNQPSVARNQLNVIRTPGDQWLQLYTSEYLDDYSQYRDTELSLQEKKSLGDKAIALANNIWQLAGQKTIELEEAYEQLSAQCSLLWELGWDDDAEKIGEHLENIEIQSTYDRAVKAGGDAYNAFQAEIKGQQIVYQKLKKHVEDLERAWSDLRSIEGKGTEKKAEEISAVLEKMDKTLDSCREQLETWRTKVKVDMTALALQAVTACERYSRGSQPQISVQSHGSILGFVQKLEYCRNILQSLEWSDDATLVLGYRDQWNQYLTQVQVIQ